MESVNGATKFAAAEDKLQLPITLECTTAAVTIEPIPRLQLVNDTSNTAGNNNTLKPIPTISIFLIVAYSVSFSLFSSYASIIGSNPSIFLLGVSDKGSITKVCSRSDPSAHEGFINLTFVEKFALQVVLIVAFILGRELKYRRRFIAGCLIALWVATLLLVGSTFKYQNLSKNLPPYSDCSNVEYDAIGFVMSTAAVWLILIGNVLITSHMLFYALNCLPVHNTRLLFYWLLWEMFLNLFLPNFILYVCFSMPSAFILSSMLIGACFIYSFVSMAVVYSTNEFQMPKSNLPIEKPEAESSEKSNTSGFIIIIRVLIYAVYFFVYLLFYCFSIHFISSEEAVATALGLTHSDFFNIILNNSNSVVFYIITVTEAIFLLLPRAIENMFHNPLKGLLGSYLVIMTTNFINMFVPLSLIITSCLGFWVFFYTIPLFIVYLAHYSYFLGSHEKLSDMRKPCLYGVRILSFLIGMLFLVPLFPFIFGHPYTCSCTPWLSLVGTICCVIGFKFYEPPTSPSSALSHFVV